MIEFHRLKEVLAFEPLSFLGMHLSAGDALAGLLAVLVTWVIASSTRLGLRRYGRRHPDANQAALYTVSRLLHYTILILGMAVALQVAGVPLSEFAVFTGAVGVGLRFGLQA